VDSSQWTVEEGRVLIIIAKREVGEFADAARTGKKPASGGFGAHPTAGQVGTRGVEMLLLGLGFHLLWAEVLLHPDAGFFQIKLSG
jgi:hypothetical protein